MRAQARRAGQRDVGEHVDQLRVEGAARTARSVATPAGWEGAAAKASASAAMRASSGISAPARPTGIAAAVPALVVEADHGAGARADVLVAQELEPVLGMAPHQLELVVGRAGRACRTIDGGSASMPTSCRKSPEAELRAWRLARQLQAPADEQADDGGVDRAVAGAAQVVGRLGEALDLGHDPPGRGGRARRGARAGSRLPGMLRASSGRRARGRPGPSCARGSRAAACPLESGLIPLSNRHPPRDFNVSTLGASMVDPCSPSTAATAPGPSTRWWARSTSSARCATRSSSTRSTTPTCSSARAAPARPRWPSCWPAR